MAHVGIYGGTHFKQAMYASLYGNLEVKVRADLARTVGGTKMSDAKPLIDMLHRMNSATGERWFACRDAVIAGIEQQAEELAAANEARQKAERERDVAREYARVRSNEALDYYNAMLNLAHEFSAKDGDNMIEVIGNGIDALRAEVERLRVALR